jgi:hypothetical protein
MPQVPPLVKMGEQQQSQRPRELSLLLRRKGPLRRRIEAMAEKRMRVKGMSQQRRKPGKVNTPMNQSNIG